PLLRMVIEIDSYGDPLMWREVERYPKRGSYPLCRCGKSGNKPYCDGAHVKARFDGVETAGNEPYLEGAEEFIGPELKLTDKKVLCIGAAFCVRDGGTWNLTVHSDRPGFREIAIEEAGDCPSGRLVVWDNQGNMIEPSFEPSIVVTVDQKGIPGELWVRGDVEIVSVDGVVYERRNRVTLCRCGESQNKPLCDGTHKNL
ncbi:MAG: CDGSH iron-sulfur domain-containing protein, partial [Deltaproteobacteria bacterium]|nr:CDGSH iron-sulfur domain-containing protein [Deltaproteobacteria bacterium]